MLEIAAQIVICLLLAALIGFIIGYLFGRNSCSPDISCDEENETPIESRVHSNQLEATEKENVKPLDEGTAPELLDTPRNGKKDDLKKIKGVGVKIEETLNEKGIYHYDQVASWNEENIKWVDANIAFPGRVKREEWVKQAKTLAKGQETEFSKRVDAGEVASSKK